MGKEGKGREEGKGRGKKGNQVEKWEGGEGSQVSGNFIPSCRHVSREASFWKILYVYLCQIRPTVPSACSAPL